MYSKGEIKEGKGNHRKIVFCKNELIRVPNSITLVRRGFGSFENVGFLLPSNVQNIKDASGISIPVRRWNIIVDNDGETVLVPTI